MTKTCLAIEQARIDWQVDGSQFQPGCPNEITQVLLEIIAVLLVLSFFIPLPFGTLRVAVGLSILVCASLPFALFVQGCRRRFSWFNRLLTLIENKLGEKWTGNLMLTRPENDPRIHFAGNEKVVNSEAANSRLEDKAQEEKEQSRVPVVGRAQRRTHHHRLEAYATLSREGAEVPNQ